MIDTPALLLQLYLGQSYLLEPVIRVVRPPPELRMPPNPPFTHSQV